MANPNQEASITGELTEEQLSGVTGGAMIGPPNAATPKPRTSLSIAEGEINSDSADDNLPDSSGGVFK